MNTEGLLLIPDGVEPTRRTAPNVIPFYRPSELPQAPESPGVQPEAASSATSERDHYRPWFEFDMKRRANLEKVLDRGVQLGVLERRGSHLYFWMETERRDFYLGNGCGAARKILGHAKCTDREPLYDIEAEIRVAVKHAEAKAANGGAA